MITFKKRELRHNDTIVEYYISPWDSEAFDFKVLNIDSFQKGKNIDSDLVVINKQMDLICKKDNVKVIVWKIDAAESDAIYHLQSYGYRFIEMSVVPYINPQHIDVDKYNSYCLTDTRLALADDVEELMRIARIAFQNDRFHKDPNFPNDKADNRYATWVLNSFEDGEEIYVIEFEKKIAGFFILKKYLDSKYAAIRLGCINPELQGNRLGISINASIVLKLREAGITLLDTSISISNFGIFNLYLSMGFKFKEQKICFHKWF